MSAVLALAPLFRTASDLAVGTWMSGKGAEEQVGQRKLKRLQDKALEGQRAVQKRAQGKQWPLAVQLVVRQCEASQDEAQRGASTDSRLLRLLLPEADKVPAMVQRPVVDQRPKLFWAELRPSVGGECARWISVSKHAGSDETRAC